MILLPVGIDISKDTLDVCVHFDGQAHHVGQFANNSDGFAELSEQLQHAQDLAGADQIHLVCEPTGGYQAALVAFAYQNGWLVSLPNPAQVRDWAKGIGIRAKTDKQDAYVLARFAAECKPTPQGQLPTEIAQLNSLLERRDELEEMRRQELNRQKIYEIQPDISAAVKSNVELLLSALQNALDEVEKAIKALLAKHPYLAEQVKLLQTVPGIGAKIVLPMLVLLHRWDVLTNGAGSAKALTAFVGLDPKPHRSGTSVNQRARISRQGNKKFRSRLYMGALGGVRGSNALKGFYQRLVAKGKAKKIALVASSRKIVVWALAVFRSNQKWDNSRHIPTA